MKELSIEDKAKRYDEAIEKAKQLSKELTVDDIVEEIFPELKESEDERIRKNCIHFLKLQKQHHAATFEIEECIAWLENQGEQKLADKVEPKFKVGDWIVSNEHPNCSNSLMMIVKVGLTDYLCRYYNGQTTYCREFIDKSYHLWTIQDAKDGDVLHSTGWHNDCVFIFKGLDNWKFDEPNENRAVATGYCCLFVSADRMKFGIQRPDCVEVSNVKPATRIQRNLLFQKMKEAGYEWDAEKKELKNIEQKQVITYLDNLPKDNWELIHEFVNKFGRIPKDEDELNVLIEYVLKRQKAALSEEDERFADKIVCVMKSSANGFPQEEAFVDEVDK